MKSKQLNIFVLIKSIIIFNFTTTLSVNFHSSWAIQQDQIQIWSTIPDPAKKDRIRIRNPIAMNYYISLVTCSSSETDMFVNPTRNRQLNMYCPRNHCVGMDRMLWFVMGNFQNAKHCQRHCAQYCPHCANKIPNLCIKTQPVMFGADATMSRAMFLYLCTYNGT